MNKRFTSGFTIVELLVVIVVIGILASITVVAYNGVQNNAYNAQIKAGVRSYYQALQVYLVQNGSYPPVPSQVTPSANDRICLGIGYPGGICGDSTFTSSEYAPFNNALGNVISLPTVTSTSIRMPYYTPQPANPPQTFTGAVFIRQDAFTVSGESNPYYLMYALYGGATECGLPVVEQESDTNPFPATVPSSQPYSWTDGRNTMCVVALQNP